MIIEVEKLIKRAEKGDKKMAVTLIIVGTFGLVLPVIPGIVLILLGIYVLTNGRFGKKYLDKLLKSNNIKL